MKMNRVYLCIDLKTFYASVECVERGLDPFKTDLIVADPSRGNGSICLAISPKMKSRGIRNRCRVFEIPKNVHPIIAKPRMKKYIEYSAKIYGVYLKYVSKEDIHPYSIDEMFLDVTSYLNLYKVDFLTLAKIIIDDIYKSTGITSSCGIGTNLYLAKVALDILAKHNSDHVAYLDEELYREKLWYYEPITDFWRINVGTENRLNKLHLKNMYDIAHCDEKILYKEFGINAEFLIDHAWGREPCTIKDIKLYTPKENSISNSQILYKDYNYLSARIVLIEMIDNMVLQLVEKNLYTNCINIYIGYSKDIINPLKISFKTKELTNSYHHILSLVLDEYDYQVNKKIPIRRIGISFGNVNQRKYEQMHLFSQYQEESMEEKLEQTLIHIKNKYGKNAILRAVSYESDATQRQRNKLIGGHNAE